MALSDIIAKIESDAAAEAARIVSTAEKRAEGIRAAAREKADAYTAEVLAAAKTVAKRESDTVVVNARLRGRDDLVAARRQLVEEALAGAAEAIASLPDDRYAAFLAARIASMARGGETLSFGKLDAAREKAVRAELSRVAPELDLAASAEAAPFDRGALLTGDRVRADLSLQALVEARRDELEMAVAAVLFGEGA